MAVGRGDKIQSLSKLIEPTKSPIAEWVLKKKIRDKVILRCAHHGRITIKEGYGYVAPSKVVYYKTREEIFLESLKDQMKEHRVLETAGFKKIRIITDENGVEKYAHPHTRLRFLYGNLPFTQTSDVHPFKRYYRYHKFHRKIIDYALSQLDDGVSCHNISRRIREKFGIKICHTSISRWAKKFRPKLVLSRSRLHDEQWNNEISIGVRRDLEARRLMGEFKSNGSTGRFPFYIHSSRCKEVGDEGAS